MKKDENVYEVIKNDERFSVLSKLLETSGIGEIIAKERAAFTFFAPTDDAFRDLPEDALEFLMSRRARNIVMTILIHHLIPESYLYSNDLRNCRVVENMTGAKLEVWEEKNVLHVGKAHIFTPGISALNGVVFPVDKVLPLVIKPPATKAVSR